MFYGNLFDVKRKDYQWKRPLHELKFRPASPHSKPRAQVRLLQFPLEVTELTYLAVGRHGLIVRHRTSLLNHLVLIKFLKLCYFAAPLLGNNCPLANTGLIRDILAQTTSHCLNKNLSPRTDLKAVSRDLIMTVHIRFTLTHINLQTGQ